MSTLCIGGVCIPYAGLVPLLLLALKWVAEQLAKVGLLPDFIIKSLGLHSSSSATCCASTKTTEKTQRRRRTARSRPRLVPLPPRLPTKPRSTIGRPVEVPPVDGGEFSEPGTLSVRAGGGSGRRRCRRPPGRDGRRVGARRPGRSPRRPRRAGRCGRARRPRRSPGRR